jgi:hypothetical protein
MRSFGLVSGALMSFGAAGPASAGDVSQQAEAGSPDNATTPPLRLELGLHAGVVTPSEGHRSLARFGFNGEIAPSLRLSRSFSVGLLLSTSRLGWSAEGPDTEFAVNGSAFPEDDGWMSTTFLALSGRWYVVDARVLPYIDLALGYGEHVQMPDHPDCSAELPVAGRLALGADFAFDDFFRVGASVAVAPVVLSSSCNSIYYTNQPPMPPSPNWGLAFRVGMTTAWDAAP